MPKHRSASTPDFAAWRVDTLITIGEAAAFVASKDRRTSDDECSARDRARKWLVYNIGIGKLALTDLRLRRMRVGELGRFLRVRRPGKFGEIPTDSAAMTDVIRDTLHIGDWCDGQLLPGDVPRCHDEIKRLAAEVSMLQRDRDDARLRIAELEPDATRWRETAAKNRASASRPRRKR